MASIALVCDSQILIALAFREIAFFPIHPIYVT